VLVWGLHPVDLAIDPPVPQRRLLTLFRGLLAIPALLLGGAYSAVVWVAALLGWWAALFTGRMPEGLRNIGAALFATSSIPTTLMVWWAAGFTLAALLFAVRSFSTRQL